MTREESLGAFWDRCRRAVEGLADEAPEAWAFGATTEHADELLALVLAGTKTATASALWDCEASDESVPEAGELSIILDGSDRPRAVIRTTRVQIVPFLQVSAEHARAEGERDRTLKSWRDLHEHYWREHSLDPRGFEPEMPVVCEAFELIWQEA